LTEIIITWFITVLGLWSLTALTFGLFALVVNAVTISGKLFYPGKLALNHPPGLPA